MKEINYKDMKFNPFNLIGGEWMLVTAGDEASCNTMTASWGHLGCLWGHNDPTAVIYLRPSRYTKEFVDEEGYFSLCVMDKSFKKQMAYHSPEFIEAKARASEWCARYNSTPYSQRAERRKMLEELFGAVGSNVSVGDNFTCGFGRNIYIGSNVSVNLNCTFIDCNRITIGNDVLIAPCVHLTTASHPVELADRLTPNWNSESGEYRWRTYAKPIIIGNGCWIGANVVVLPGVTIGDGTVIGAGSVVTKDIPSNVVAVGNPCRVIRKINQ